MRLIDIHDSNMAKVKIYIDNLVSAPVTGYLKLDCTNQPLAPSTGTFLTTGNVASVYNTNAPTGFNATNNNAGNAAAAASQYSVDSGASTAQFGVGAASNADPIIAGNAFYAGNKHVILGVLDATGYLKVYGGAAFSELFNVSPTGGVTVTAMSSAGFVKNSAAGLLSGGNGIAVADISDIAANYLGIHAKADDSDLLDGHDTAYFQTALGFTAENVANKDTDGTLAANSDTKYASQKATKTYADTKVALTLLPRRFTMWADEMTALVGAAALSVVRSQSKHDMYGYNPNFANGDSCGWGFVCAAQDCYFTVQYNKLAQGAIIDFYLDGSIVSAGLDTYNATSTDNNLLTFTVAGVTAGYHAFKWVINGRNAANVTDWRFYVTKVWGKPLTD